MIRMVQFRQGMLGVAVVAVAIAGALLGSWAMSMDVEERTVTTYDALTDITPLFDTEMAPAYTDYNPATNYTGYYTESTTIGDHRYFGGVDYTEAKRPNNYKVDQPPLEQLEGTITVPTDGSASINRFQLQRWIDGGQYAVWSTDVEAYTLADLLALVTTETTGTFKLASNEGLSALTNVAGPVNVDWLLFGSMSAHTGSSSARTYFFGTEEFYRNFPSADNQYHNHIALSMSADLDRNVVTLYSDNAFQNQLKVVSLDDCIILAGGQTATGDHDVCLGTTGTYEYSKFPEASYMDPSGGVEVEL